ncbi:MAG: CPBP family intramembrane metalloprotease [Anaerolineaceae bacterium]|nr:CPBP family intramembrane metalloprotease [Anaerolineaceae bacterium]
MSISSSIIHMVIILVVSALLIITGLKKQPGIGILGAIMIIVLFLWACGYPLSRIGFARPQNWFFTILMGLGLGLIIQLLSVMLIEPLTEKITHSKHDHSIIDAVKGNWKVFLQWMLMVWILVAVIEEGIYRGYLMTEMKNLLGLGFFALIINLLYSSVVFGLSHGYQGSSGILSTGIVGVILGMIFILSDFNLWLAIFTHGFIDTIGIGLIAIGGDEYLKKQFWLKRS